MKWTTSVITEVGAVIGICSSGVLWLGSKVFVTKKEMKVFELTHTKFQQEIIKQFSVITKHMGAVEQYMKDHE